MSWLTDNAGNTGIVISKDITKAMIGQARVDYDSPANPDGSRPTIDYHIHGNVLFFGVTTRTVTEYRGLTKDAAVAVVNANTAYNQKFAVYKKQFGTTGFWAELLVEVSSKTTSARRVDASGQYAVTVTETTTSVPGATLVQEVS